MGLLSELLCVAWSAGATRATCSALKSAGSATVTSLLGALLLFDVIDANLIGGWACLVRCCVWPGQGALHAGHVLPRGEQAAPVTSSLGALLLQSE
jgi:hypothetical protein